MTRHWAISSALTAAILFFNIMARAAEPAAFIAVDKSWGAPSFKRGPESLNFEEKWTYNKNNGTLILTKQACSSCKPVPRKRIDSDNELEGNAAILVDHFGKPASFTFAKEPSPYHLVSFGIVVPPSTYHILLVVSDKAPSAESFLLQQEFIRMINGFRP